MGSTGKGKDFTYNEKANTIPYEIKSENATSHSKDKKHSGDLKDDVPHHLQFQVRLVLLYQLFYKVCYIKLYNPDIRLLY